jgi:hypothetical protein
VRTPARAKLEWTDGNGSPHVVEAQVNPNEYSLSRGLTIAPIAIPGLDAPILQFVKGDSESLTVELFFDTTDEREGDRPVPVTRKSDKVYDLVKIDPQTHAPPIATFSWGTGFPGSEITSEPQRRTNMKCVAERVQQRFTLFADDGTPLRAVLSLTLKEYKTLAEQVAALNLQSADHTRAHVVRAGETLSAIAARRYGTHREWRRIAEHNGIDDPAALEPGRVLELPPIPT